MTASRNSEIIFEAEKEVEGLEDTSRLKKWIRKVIKKENQEIQRIAYFFISDDALLQMNKKFLQHDDLTDILTFPYSYDPIAADIYISYERVADNAVIHGCQKDQELRRVVIHGALHMCGWSDKTTKEKEAMRQREDQCLSLWKL